MPRESFWSRRWRSRRSKTPPRAACAITVRDARTKDLLPKVQVKVIGSDNPEFISGETDLRGVFVAEGVRGMVTAVARKGDLEYAFYRGTTFVGPATAVPSDDRPLPRSEAGRKLPNQPPSEIARQQSQVAEQRQ